MTSIKVQNFNPQLGDNNQKSQGNPHQNIYQRDISSPRGGRSKKVWEWFVNFNSIGGFTQARDSDNKVSTCIWTILFLVGFGLTMNGLADQILFFLEYNSTMNIELAHNSSGMIFPSVAVCNQNRIHCGHLYEKIISCSKDPICASTRETLYCEIFVMTQCSVSMTLAHVIEYGERQWKDICDNQFNQLSEEDYEIVEKIYHANYTVAPNIFYDIYVELTADEMDEFSHRPEDMIKECHWNGEVNDICKDFMTKGGTHIYVPKFGVCFVINFKGLHHSRFTTEFEELKANAAGADHGLRLILDIQSQYYMRNGMTEKQGVGLVIEEDTRLPNVVSEHIPLYPHSSTYIAMTERNILRLKSPYPSHCTSEYPEKYKNMTKTGEFDFSYSEKTCQSFCHNYYVHKYCGCYLATILESSLGWKQFSKSEFCGYNFTRTNSCFNKALEIYDKENEALCECLPECFQPIFQKQISSTAWPSDAYLPKVSAKYGHDDATEPDFVNHEINVATNLNDSDVDGVKGKLMDQYMKYVSKNLLEVDVFFTSLTYENIVETPSMTGIELMSNIGGALSLYLGVSFVAAFEILELIVRFILSPFISK